MKTRSYMYLKLLTLLALGLVLSPLSASAQGGGFRSTSQSARDGLSDGSSFYMSRRQMQVVDDSPIIKYSGGGQAPPGAVGGLGGAAAPLPRAGFQSYSSSINQAYQAPLPKVNNGVPPKPVFSAESGGPGGPGSLKAKAGGLRKGRGKGKPDATAKASAPAVPPGAQGTHAYDSYKGYNPAAAVPYGSSAAGAGAAAGASSTTQTNVKGSVLHWSRRRRGLQ
jgi:hypothetical protein